MCQYMFLIDNGQLWLVKTDHICILHLIIHIQRLTAYKTANGYNMQYNWPLNGPMGPKVYQGFLYLFKPSILAQI